ncbi:MAG: hypothetical protein K0Q76_2307 [Panacagrimonas sp.]|jgi:hemolysin activation/secretion protein|nr:ShlB/FhaC/HecB family hemolysin secretion/activation protein [Panacagrimonas sp.]MCC2657199.1 hypothetical protein [Panacagrimonas sp.]
MPIALPAPSTPELGSAETIRGQGSAYVSAAFQENQVHVIGPEVVSKEALEGAITGAENLSDVVRRVQAAYYLAGYPSVRLAYALAAPDLYIGVTLGKITKVEAPERYRAYFDQLEGADPLTDEKLEPGRTFASLHADRAGQAATPTLIPDGDGSILRIEPTDTGPERTAVGLGVGNPGNRFVGRHFADWFAKHSFTTGDEVRFTGRYGLEGLDHDDGARGYGDFSAAWGRVTPWGLLALQGRFTGYQVEVDALNLPDPVKLTGNIGEVELGWTGLLHSSFYSRWGVSAKVDYTRKILEEASSEEDIQQQEYGSVEAATQYSRVFRPMDLPTELSAGVMVRSGLGDNKIDQLRVRADLGYLLFRPTLGASVRFGEYATIRLAMIAQITDDTLPEQQQWVMGGIGNIESYLPGVASGDSGGLARLQWETDSQGLFGFAVTPRLFVEYGYAKFENDVSGDDERKTLVDGGASLTFSRGPFDASVSYAESIQEKKIDKDTLHDSDANMFFRVAMKF